MSKKDDGGGFDNGGQLFPCYEVKQDGGHLTSYSGISRRDWLAGLAMQGMLSTMAEIMTINYSLITEDAYKMSDAMIEQGNKT